MGDPIPTEAAGYLCAYTPVEILLAAGFEPVRLFGLPGETERADAVLSSTLCPYVRACMEEGLQGGAPDTVLFAGCCDSMRRLYDAWTYYCGPGFTHLIEVPRDTGQYSLSVFESSIWDLIGRLEEHTGTPITAAAIVEAIEIRRGDDSVVAGLTDLLRQTCARDASLVYESFKDAQVDSPKESPRDAGDTGVLISGGSGGGTGREGSVRGKPVMVTGNVLQSGKLIGLIEECGGRVSCLDLCSAERFPTWGPEDERVSLPADLDGLVRLLAKTYLDRVPCPRMLDRGRRYEAVLRSAEESGAAGVIYLPLMFCDPFLYDLPGLKYRLDSSGIPGLVMESDYRDENPGQLRTRIEAFLEML